MLISTTAFRSAAEAFNSAAKFLSIMNSAMIISGGLSGSGIRLRALKSMPNGIGRGFSAIGALRLVQNISHMGRDRVETDREHQRNILVRPPDRQQAQNLDFARREIVRKRDIAASRMQQGVDIDNQARHAESPRELLGLAQLLKARAAPCPPAVSQESAIAKQRPGKRRPRTHGAIERQSLLEVLARKIRPIRGVGQHGQVKFGGAEAHGGGMVGGLPCIRAQ